MSVFPQETGDGRGMAAAIAAGWLADRLAGDPARFHPVAGFGCIAGALERRMWRPSRSAGAVYVASLVGALGVAVASVDRALAARPRQRAAFRVLVVWTTLGGLSLERAAFALAKAVDAGDIDVARSLAPTLVGRDPSELDSTELCRAVVESVAENTSDAVVAPLLWSALFGAPGAAAYRAINTLDAMVGHRSERYVNFGWAAARLDDVANWLPARVTALLAIAWAPSVGGNRGEAWRTAWQDGAGHPSPNAGRVEGAFAGALSLRLGGLNRYAHGIERRPTLGSGAPATVGDIDRSVRLARLVAASSVVLCAALAWSVRR
jgi:adenosylcobinamide-phosphate synthase